MILTLIYVSIGIYALMIHYNNYEIISPYLVAFDLSFAREIHHPIPLEKTNLYTPEDNVAPYF